MNLGKGEGGVDQNVEFDICHDDIKKLQKTSILVIDNFRNII